MSDRLRSLSSFADSFINGPLLSARNLLDFCAILGEWNVNFLSGGPFVFVLHFNVTGRLAAVKMDAGIPSVVYDPAHQQHVLLLFLYLFFFSLPPAPPPPPPHWLADTETRWSPTWEIIDLPPSSPAPLYLNEINQPRRAITACAQVALGRMLRWRRWIQGTARNWLENEQ